MPCESANRPTVRYALRCWVEDRISVFLFGDKTGEACGYYFRFGATEAPDSL